MNNLYQIEFTLKDLSQRPQQQITHIGGRLADGNKWKITAQDAMEAIRTGMARYYVRIDGGLRDYLMIGSHPLYGAFLTIAADPREPSALLSLPETLDEEPQPQANPLPPETPQSERCLIDDRPARDWARF